MAFLTQALPKHSTLKVPDACDAFLSEVLPSSLKVSYYFLQAIARSFFWLEFGFFMSYYYFTSFKVMFSRKSLLTGLIGSLFQDFNVSSESVWILVLAKVQFRAAESAGKDVNSATTP